MIKLGMLCGLKRHNDVHEYGNLLASSPKFHHPARDYAMIYSHMAMSYFESGKIDLCLAACEKMQVICPDFSQAWFYPTLTHHMLAKQTVDRHYKREHLEKAIELYKKSDQVEQDEESDNTYYLDHCTKMLERLDASASYRI